MGVGGGRGLQCAVGERTNTPCYRRRHGTLARSIDPAIPQIRRACTSWAALLAAALVASPCPICWASRRAGEADRKAVITPCRGLRSARQQGPLTHWSRRSGTWPLECQALHVLGRGCLDAEVCEGSQTVNVHVLTMHYGERMAVKTNHGHQALTTKSDRLLMGHFSVNCDFLPCSFI
jgi:hypothetical protein